MVYDESLSEPLTESDYENATKFHPDEAPPEQREHYRILAGYNTGLSQRDWTDQEVLRRADNLAIFDAIAGQLELTRYQKTEGRQLFDRLNPNDFGHAVELLAFAVCVLVVKDDGRLYHPFSPAGENDALFARLAADLGYTDRRVFHAMLSIAEDRGMGLDVIL